MQLSSIQNAAGAAAGIGLVAVLYSGLGWLSSLREALTEVFEETKDEVPGFLTGKLRDLTVMVTIGVVLILSVVVSAVVTSLSDRILDWLELGSGLGWLVNLLGIAIGLLANMVLFFLFFKLLADPPLPSRSMWSGALLGAVLFELLKQASRFLLQATSESPAFQAFGIALILVVWINYFSRVVMYAAAWAYTSPEAREIRDREEAEEAARIAATRVDLKKAPEPEVVRQGRAGQGVRARWRCRRSAWSPRSGGSHEARAQARLSPDRSRGLELRHLGDVRQEPVCRARGR